MKNIGSHLGHDSVVALQFDESYRTFEMERIFEQRYFNFRASQFEPRGLIDVVERLVGAVE